MGCWCLEIVDSTGLAHKISRCSPPSVGEAPARGEEGEGGLCFIPGPVTGQHTPSHVWYSAINELRNESILHINSPIVKPVLKTILELGF